MIVKPKKSLGQNYLIDENILKVIANSVHVRPENNVIEIGPGTGNLTKHLNKLNFNKFIVVEKDIDLYQQLLNEFKDIEVINADILKLNFENFNLNNLIIFGNLPYNISSQILIKLIRGYCSNFKFEKLILMFQKELAERILAKFNTKDYGRLSIISQWKMEIKKLKDVHPNSFFPVPKVASSILIFTPKKISYKLKNIKNLEHVTNIFFNLKRKMIKKPLNILFKDTKEISQKLKLDLSSRPQTIEPKLYYEICNEYEKLLK